MNADGALVHSDRSPPVRLISLKTAVPAHRFPQGAVADEARRVFASRFDGFGQIESVFHNAGIATRYSARPLDWFREPQGWPERTEAYREAAVALFRTVSERALAAAGVAPAAVDTIVTVSSTGIATPSLEAHAMQGSGFRDDVRRVPVFGLGCAGGVTGLALASRLARAAHGTTVLLVVIELCTLAFRLDRLTKANIVATALFGDGAAAAVVRSGEGPGLIEVRSGGEHTWPATLDIMGWDIDPIGFGAVFSRSIPDFIRQNMRAAADRFLSRCADTSDRMHGPLFHPGGARVIDALEDAFALQTGTLRRERSVLRDYGNMSAPTVLFVLERAIEARATGRMMMAALGPGFTASFLTLHA